MTEKIAKWLFLIYIVSLPLVRPFYTEIQGLRVPYSDFIFVAVFGFLLVSFFSGEAKLQNDKFYIFLAFYGLALTISTIFSTEPKRSLFKLFGEFYLFALAVAAFNFARDAAFLKRMTAAWLIGTSLTVLASLAGFALFYIGFKSPEDNNFLSHFGSLPAGNYPRIHALFANANMMCNFLNVGLMLAFLAEKAFWLDKIRARILQIGILFAAIFTFSAGLGGLILSSGIWVWVLLKEKQKFLLSKIALISAIILSVFVFCSTLVTFDTQNTTHELSLPFSGKKIEPSVRVLVWENALERFTEFPLVGRGTGTNAAEQKYSTLSGDNQILMDAHNVWLNILGQIGLLGFFAFILLNIFLIKRCRFRFEEYNEQNLVHLALSSAFAGAFLYQGLSGSFEDARHLWVLFGLLVGISTISKNDISEASKAP